MGTYFEYPVFQALVGIYLNRNERKTLRNDKSTWRETWYLSTHINFVIGFAFGHVDHLSHGSLVVAQNTPVMTIAQILQQTENMS